MTNQPTAGPDRGETPSPRPDTSIPAADVASFADILGLDPTSAARRDDARRAADYHDAHTAGELLDIGRVGGAGGGACTVYGPAGA